MNKVKLFTLILTLAGSLFAVLASIVVIVLIIQKVSLHRVRFYIIINFCITNIVILLMVVFGTLYTFIEGDPIEDNKMNIVLSIAGTV